MVEDVQSDIKEVVHFVPDEASRIVYAHGAFGFETRRHDQLYPDLDERGDIKGVFEMTLKCGSRIVLDLTGAQWNLQDDGGAHGPVTYCADYWSRWDAAIKYRIPFRSHALKHTRTMAGYRMITSQTLIMETSLYFNVLMTSACKAELGFHPRDLLDMDIASYSDAKQRFLAKTTLYLQKRPMDVDNGSHLNVLDKFDLRHPRIIAKAPKPQPQSNGSLPLDIGDMANFDWKALSRLIQQPGLEVTLKEKRRAKALQKKRSVYKELGTWKMVFLEDTLPSARVPVGCVSENPGWKLD